MKNIFGIQTSTQKEIASNLEIRPVLLKIMRGLTDYLEIDSSLGPKFIEFAEKSDNDYDYEREAHKLLQTQEKVELKSKLSTRSKTMYAQVLPHLIPGSLLDFGCGDGKIGEMLIKDNYDLTFADVYKHPHIAEANLKFEHLNQKGKISNIDNSFDNCLILTVLHHSDFPIENIEELYRITKKGGKVIVIETVYDVHGKGLSEEERQRISYFLELNAENQMKVCAFFDHFFNRVFYYSENPKTKVNMPYNYNTPEGWKKFFEEKGFKTKNMIHIGLDQPLGPAEYHVLYVLEKPIQ
jgi:2-polyprenyl-3-methyl-5-hydroxy-6-metoxy-1,4-benzoquinol methylase